MAVRPYPLDMSGWVRPGIGRMVERMLARSVGLRVDIGDVLPERNGVVEQFVPPPPSHDARRRARSPACRVGSAASTRLAGPTTRGSSGSRKASSELAALDPRSLGWTELLQVCRRTLAVADLITDLRVDYLPRTGFDLLRLLALLTLLGASSQFWLLTAGARTRTGDANRALEELASQVRADPPVRAAFGELDPPNLLTRLDSDAGSPVSAARCASSSMSTAIARR